MCTLRLQLSLLGLRLPEGPPRDPSGTRSSQCSFSGDIRVMRVCPCAWLTHRCVARLYQSAAGVRHRHVVLERSGSNIVSPFSPPSSPIDRACTMLPFSLQPCSPPLSHQDAVCVSVFPPPCVVFLIAKLVPCVCPATDWVASICSFGTSW